MCVLIEYLATSGQPVREDFAILQAESLGLVRTEYETLLKILCESEPLRRVRSAADNQHYIVPGPAFNKTWQDMKAYKEANLQ